MCNKIAGLAVSTKKNNNKRGEAAEELVAPPVMTTLQYSVSDCTVENCHHSATSNHCHSSSPAPGLWTAYENNTSYDRSSSTENDCGEQEDAVVEQPTTTSSSSAAEHCYVEQVHVVEPAPVPVVWTLPPCAPRTRTGATSSSSQTKNVGLASTETIDSLISAITLPDSLVCNKEGSYKRFKEPASSVTRFSKNILDAMPRFPVRQGSVMEMPGGSSVVSSTSFIRKQKAPSSSPQNERPTNSNVDTRPKKPERQNVHPKKTKAHTSATHYVGTTLRKGLSFCGAAASAIAHQQPRRISSHSSSSSSTTMTTNNNSGRMTLPQPQQQQRQQNHHRRECDSIPITPSRRTSVSSASVSSTEWYSIYL